MHLKLALFSPHITRMAADECLNPRELERMENLERCCWRGDLASDWRQLSLGALFKRDDNGLQLRPFFCLLLAITTAGLPREALVCIIKALMSPLKHNHLATSRKYLNSWKKLLMEVIGWSATWWGNTRCARYVRFARYARYARYG